jgi:hypothetical protein
LFRYTSVGIPNSPMDAVITDTRFRRSVTPANGPVYTTLGGSGGCPDAEERQRKADGRRRGRERGRVRGRVRERVRERERENSICAAGRSTGRRGG